MAVKTLCCSAGSWKPRILPAFLTSCGMSQQTVVNGCAWIALMRRKWIDCRRNTMMCFRLLMNGSGGLLLDASGRARRRWLWNDDDSPRHNHVPPLYPLHMALSASVSVHVSSQLDMTIAFSCKQRTCRFSVAAAGQPVGMQAVICFSRTSLSMLSHCWVACLAF